jgi:hypothetical protein
MFSWLIKYISSKRQERKEEESNETRSTTEQQQAVNKVLDETCDNIKKTTDEARKEISHYTQIVNDYQEKTIQAIRELQIII